jgi:phosphatidylglycerol:prolipoprotein diacylglycerol transferase
MFPIVNIGPLALQVPGLMMILGLWLGLLVSEKINKEIKINEIYNLLFIMLISGLIGARIGYVIQYQAAFSDNPINIISLNSGMLDFKSGIGIGFIAFIVYCYRRKLHIWSTLDALTPLFAIMGIALSFAHLSSGEVYGIQTSLPWGIKLWGAQRHPTQIYEIFFGVAILISVLKLVNIGRYQNQGVVFLGFIAMYAFTYIFIDAFRAAQTLTIAGLRTSQIIAWLILALSLWLLGKRLPIEKTKHSVNGYN